MKRISIMVNIVLAVAVVALYALYFTDKCHKNSAGSTAEGSAVELPSGSIVYIQLDSLLGQFDFFHALKSELEAKAKVIDDDLTKRGRAFERDYIDFTEKVQKGLLTRSQMESQGAQLENRQRDLEQFAQQKRAELAEEEQVMINKVFYELNTYLESYNKEHDFALILSTSAASNNVMSGSSKSLDITKEVAAGLNAQYAVQNKKR